MALDVDWLASKEGQAIISAAQTIGVDPNDIEGLRKNFSEVPTELIGSAINQNWLRKRAQFF